MSFEGLIGELPIGQAGLTGTVGQNRVAPDQLILSNNITYEDGTLRKEGGTTKYNSSAVGSPSEVQGGWDWHPTGSVQRMIVLTDAGTLFKDTGSGNFSVTLKTGLTVNSTTVPVFVEAGEEAAADDRLLVIFTGVNTVQVLTADGTTTSDIATPPADWATNQAVTGLIHEGRLWGFAKHTAYYSTTANHEDFTGSGSGSISVFAGEGEEIVDAVAYKGVIILWKRPLGIYLIDTSNSEVSKWRVTVHSRSIGGISPQGHALVDDDVIFMDPSGNIHAISAIQEFGNVGTRSVSDLQDMNPFIRRNVNLSQLSSVRMLYYVAKREIHIGVAGTGDTTLTRRLVMDFNNPQALRWRFSDRDVTQSLWLRTDSEGVPRPLYGDNLGFVRFLDKSSRSHDGGGYTGEFQSGHTDLSFLDPTLATRRKNLAFLELMLAPTGDWDLSVDIILDGETSQTVLFNMGAGAALGAFVLNTNKLSADSIISKRKRIVGGGKRISIKGSNNGAGQDFSIDKFILYFTAGDEREL